MKFRWRAIRPSIIDIYSYSLISILIQLEAWLDSRWEVKQCTFSNIPMTDVRRIFCHLYSRYIFTFSLHFHFAFKWAHFIQISSNATWHEKNSWSQRKSRHSRKNGCESWHNSNNDDGHDALAQNAKLSKTIKRFRNEHLIRSVKNWLIKKDLQVYHLKQCLKQCLPTLLLSLMSRKTYNRIGNS